MSKRTATLDCKAFSYDSEFDCYEGKLSVGGISYEGYVKSWDGNMDKAWKNATRIFDFIANHFDRIEKAVREDFIPTVRHWAEEQQEEGYDDRRLGDLAIKAMKRSKPVRFRICGDMISDVVYAGPRFLLGHRVNVKFDEDGRLLAIGMEG
jgi:hypothetical protein